jgi:hypothetical protein
MILSTLQLRTIADSANLTADDPLLTDLTAAEQAPTDPMPLYRLARRCRAAGHVSAWRMAVEAALAREHDTYEHLYHRGCARLMLGDWGGWSDYEARLFRPTGSIAEDPALPWTRARWRGNEDLRDRTIVVIAETGLGDAVRMLQYLPALSAQGGRVIAAVQPELVSFVEHNYGDHVTVAFRDLVPSLMFDSYVWNMSLPSIFGDPPPPALLSAPAPSRASRDDTEKSRIGICWASDEIGSDERCSMDLSYWAPLLTNVDVEWHSLQLGDRAREADAYPGLWQSTGELYSVADLANVIATLDYVISTDSVACHLAGRLGVPTCALLNVDPGWRWSMADNTSWNPNTHIIRQPRPGDWANVVAALQVHLDDHFPSLSKGSGTGRGSAHLVDRARSR